MELTVAQAIFAEVDADVVLLLAAGEDIGETAVVLVSGGE
jgi:hypothetical protein